MTTLPRAAAATTTCELTYVVETSTVVMLTSNPASREITSAAAAASPSRKVGEQNVLALRHASDRLTDGASSNYDDDLSLKAPSAPLCPSRYRPICSRPRTPAPRRGDARCAGTLGQEGPDERPKLLRSLHDLGVLRAR